MKDERQTVNGERVDEGFVTVGVDLEFSYAAGETASRFLTALRDEKKIYGTRCPACRRVLVPARSFCPRCFADTTEWIEVGPAGTVSAFAPLPPLPEGERLGMRAGLALIRLDGADTNFLHLLANAPLDSLAAGMRVEAVFAERRSGSILDIACFQPVPQTDGGMRRDKGERNE